MPLCSCTEDDREGGKDAAASSIHGDSRKTPLLADVSLHGGGAARDEFSVADKIRVRLTAGSFLANRPILPKIRLLPEACRVNWTECAARGNGADG